MALTYQTGEEVQRGDRVTYGGNHSHASSSCGMRLINCGVGGLNLSCIGLIAMMIPTGRVVLEMKRAGNA